MLREVGKNVAVASIMYGMDGIAGNKSEIDKLEVELNRVGRMVLDPL